MGIDLTRFVEFCEKLYIENWVMKSILSERVEGFDWNELDEGLADPALKAEVRRKFDLLYRALGNDPTFPSAVRDFLQQRSSEKPN